MYRGYTQQLIWLFSSRYVWQWSTCLRYIVFCPERVGIILENPTRPSTYLSSVPLCPKLTNVNDKILSFQTFPSRLQEAMITARTSLARQLATRMSLVPVVNDRMHGRFTFGSWWDGNHKINAEAKGRLYGHWRTKSIAIYSITKLAHTPRMPTISSIKCNKSVGLP